MFARLAVPAALAALASVAHADAISTQGLSVLVPGGDSLWWVASSINTLAWTCKTTSISNFTVLIGNTDTNVMPSPQAILSQENNFDCSKTVDQSILAEAAGSNYFIQLADPFNNTNIYAQSANFEIKPVGSVYPPASATPSDVPGGAAATSGSSNSSASATGSGASSGSGSASATSAASSGSASPTQSSAAGRTGVVPAAIALAAAALGLALA
ncbi:hypothetical protein EIP86_006209 [Pleurotus ostreatoroseus]|nr:hypothetical protein EIP86_006209 [Pleurotus ostreatoroseus]